MRAAALAATIVCSVSAALAGQPFHDAAQRVIALQLRLAHHAATTCGFVLDADRFKRRLVEDDLTFDDLFRREYTPAEIAEIASDATAAARSSGPASRYCEDAWREYGPGADFGDNVVFKCRAQAGCR